MNAPNRLITGSNGDTIADPTASPVTSQQKGGVQPVVKRHTQSLVDQLHFRDTPATTGGITVSDREPSDDQAIVFVIRCNRAAKLFSYLNWPVDIVTHSGHKSTRAVEHFSTVSSVNLPAVESDNLGWRLTRETPGDTPGRNRREERTTFHTTLFARRQMNLGITGRLSRRERQPFRTAVPHRCPRSGYPERTGSDRHDRTVKPFGGHTWIVSRLDRLVQVAPPPAVVDWLIGGCVAFEVGSGLVSFTVGTPEGAWLVWLHAFVGVTLVGLLAFKLARVRHRIVARVSWDRQTPLSILMALLAVGSLTTGIFWTLGGNVPILGWTTLNLHVGLGLVLVPLLFVHLRARFRLPRRTDLDRRAAMRTGATLAVGAVAWQATETADRLLGGARRRFTGSKPTGDLYDTDTEGGGFPVTSWVADDPEPIDPESWRLQVGGYVDEPLALTVDDVDPETSLTATLDCTSGWYTVQEWGGVRVGDLLDTAGVDEEAQYVRFVSVTGYRWSLPVAEARDALLATHVGGNPLSHGHGAPARLVAPGRRGFQWVKWVERVELRREPDPAQWVVTLVSGFD